MLIGGLQKTSLIDYPGKISAVAFLQGCNFRCPYCHNPELVNPELFGPPMPQQDLWALLEKRRGKLDAVVITGGEPCLHKDLMALIQRIKAMGYLVKLDTNGAYPEMLGDIIQSKCLDYIAMDIKGPLEKYAALTGSAADSEAIQASLRLIMHSDIDYEFRTTLVRTLISPGDVLAIGHMIAGARRYALQRFVPSKHVEVSYARATSFEPSELEMLCEPLKRLVGELIVR
jgi:pyruvate formate lyase activating enzyme